MSWLSLSLLHPFDKYSHIDNASMAESEDQTTAIVQRLQQSKDDNGTGSCTNPRSDINLPSSVRIQNMSRNYMSYNPHSPHANNIPRDNILLPNHFNRTGNDSQIYKLSDSLTLLKLLQPKPPSFQSLTSFSFSTRSFFSARPLFAPSTFHSNHSFNSIKHFHSIILTNY